MSSQLVMAFRDGEAEPVVVDAGSDGTFTYTLDDGVVLVFDRADLLAAQSASLAAPERRAA